MRKTRNLLLGAVLLGGLALSSCSVTMPVTATSNPVGSKVGTASSTAIFGFFPDGGDLSIQTAAQNGGISRISTVDFRHSLDFFYIIQTYETIVTGE